MKTFILNNFFDLLTLCMILCSISLQLDVLKGTYTNRMLKKAGVVSAIAFVLLASKCVHALIKTFSDFHTLLLSV